MVMLFLLCYFSCRKALGIILQSQDIIFFLMMKPIEWQKKQKIAEIFWIGSTTVGAMFSHKIHWCDMRKQLNGEGNCILNIKVWCC